MKTHETSGPLLTGKHFVISATVMIGVALVMLSLIVEDVKELSSPKTVSGGNPVTAMGDGHPANIDPVTGLIFGSQPALNDYTGSTVLMTSPTAFTGLGVLSSGPGMGS